MTKTIRHLFTPQSSNNHRPRVLHPAGYLVFVGILFFSQVFIHLLSSGTGALPAILGFSSSITVPQVVEGTNAERAKSGLQPLTLNEKLSSAAVAKGNNMCAEQYWAHVSPKGTTPWVYIAGSGYKYSVAGENLARDFSDTPSMVAAWMNSPTHKANIVNTKYADIGIAVINCSLLGSDTALVVQMFGSQVVTRAPQVPVVSRQEENSQALGIEQTLENPEQQLESEQVAGEDTVPPLLAQAEPSLVLPAPTESLPTVSVYTPLQVGKAVALSILFLLLGVLALDMWFVSQRNIIRVAGRNVGHILLFSGILIVVLFVKAGMTL